MEIWGIFVLIFLIVLFLYFASSLILTYILNNKIFSVRGKDPSHPIYVHFEDYPSLVRSSYETIYDGYKIKGYIYQDKNIEKFKGFIILSHGLFGTHLQYLVDVNYLTKEGYQVLCYDQFGVGESEGESQVSLYHGILVLDCVINDVEKRNIHHNLPLILYGHSWGAYCSLGVLKNHDEIKKAVLRSGPVKPSYAGLSILKTQSKFLYHYLKPSLPFCLGLITSFQATKDCVKHLSKNKNTKILIVYSENDPMVNLKNSQYYYFKKHKNDNVTLFLTKDGLHNSIITEESYAKFVNKAKEYKNMMKNLSDDKKALASEKFLSTLSRADMVIYKEDVKDEILSFLN